MERLRLSHFISGQVFSLKPHAYVNQSPTQSPNESNLQILFLTLGSPPTNRHNADPEALGSAPWAVAHAFTTDASAETRMSLGDEPAEHCGADDLCRDDPSPPSVQSGETITSLHAVIYAAIYGIAKPLMDDERDDHTLQTTAVVHEAWLRLREQPEILAGPGHADFGRIAANSIRQILVDHARHRSRLKRGGGWRRIAIENATDLGRTRQVDVDLLDLDDAMSSLERRSARQCRVIEMRFFAGMTNPEIADALGVCTKTVTDDWNAGRAYLLSRIASDHRS